MLMIKEHTIREEESDVLTDNNTYILSMVHIP